MSMHAAIWTVMAIVVVIPSAIAQPSEFVAEEPDSHRLVVENAAAAEVAQRALELVGKRVEHGRSV